MLPVEAAPSFALFNKLPTEIRLMIWEWASNHPRIVHLSRKRLASPDDPAWWRRVRSDKPIEAEVEDVESDYGSVIEDGIDFEDIERTVAMKRLLTPDNKCQGNLSREDAKAILHGRAHRQRYRMPLSPGFDCPKHLFGLESESPVPGVLLACRESFGVGSYIYSRAFGSLGAIASTWFNFGQDTLYVDGLTHEHRSGHYGLFGSGSVLRTLFARDDLTRVERLAVRGGWIQTYLWIDARDRSFRDEMDDESAEDPDPEPIQQPDESWLASFRELHALMPNIEQLTIVDGHYAHQDRTMARWTRVREQYVDLKYMNSSFDLQFCWRLNGFRIDAALLQGGIHPDVNPILDQVDTIQDYWDEFGDQSPWQLPEVDVQVIVSAADEARLLQDAYLYEKKHNKGCWYINPSDSTDCDYFAGDEDDDLQSLV